MSNKKVSEMEELTDPGTLDNKYVYVVTQNEEGNSYNKMSLETVKRSISGTSSGGGNISEGTIKNQNLVCWDSSISFGTEKTLTMPCDVFVWKDPDVTVTPQYIAGAGASTTNFNVKWAASGITIDGKNISSHLLASGIYCPAGTTIGGSGHNIAPLLYGNVDEEKVISCRNKNPKELLAFMTANTTYLTNCSVYGGKERGQVNVEITADTPDDEEFYTIGVKCSPQTGIYAQMIYPSHEVQLDGTYPDMTRKTLTSATGTSFSIVCHSNRLRPLTDFNVFSIVAFNFSTAQMGTR